MILWPTNATLPDITPVLPMIYKLKYHLGIVYIYIDFMHMSVYILSYFIVSPFIASTFPFIPCFSAFAWISGSS